MWDVFCDRDPKVNRKYLLLRGILCHCNLLGRNVNAGDVSATAGFEGVAVGDRLWGDGTAIRSYTYVDDMVEGIFTLMHSDLDGPVNIGSPEYNSVDELVATVGEAAGKHFKINHVEGPVGVQSRNFSNERIYSTGWRARYALKDGIAETYRWIADQVETELSEAAIAKS